MLTGARSRPAGSASSVVMRRRSQPAGSASSARSGAKFRPPPAPPSGCSKFFGQIGRSRRRPARALARRAATSVSTMSASLIRPGPTCVGGRWRHRFRSAPARRSRSSGPLRRRGQEHAVSSPAAVLRSGQRRISFDGVAIRDRIRELRSRIAPVRDLVVFGASRGGENIRSVGPAPAMTKSSAPPTLRTPPNFSGCLRAGPRRSSAQARRDASGRPAPAHRVRAR